MSDHYQIAIIGAGPAGLSAAANAAKQNISHCLFERKEIGNTIYEYQLRKFVMAEPQALPLRSPLPFGAGTREQVLENWNKSLQDLGVCVQTGDVSEIKKNGDRFKIQHSSGESTADNVILSIGMQGTPRKLSVPGAELSHVHYTLSDPDALKSKNILVIGAGDAAIENALALYENNNVSLLNLGDDFPRAKEANANKILEVIAAGEIKLYANSNVLKIESDFCILTTPEGEVEVPINHIIARIGGTLPRKFLEDCGIKFPSEDRSAVPQVNSRYESNVPGLYILGALIGYPLIKQCMNQGFEVIEHILGNEIEPADQPLIDKSLESMSGSSNEKLQQIRAALPIFRELSDAQFRELIIDSKIHNLPSGKIVYRKNDYTDTFFSIIQGQVEVLLEDKDKKIPIGEGDFFGEMGLLSGRRRNASVQTSQPSILLETPRKQILKLMRSVEAVKRSLDQVFMLRALQSSVFPDTPVEFLKTLVESAKLQNFKKGETLFSEGAVGDCLFLIRKGSVKVSMKNASGKNITRTYIPAGHIVGEMALLSDDETPRTATVSAAVPSETIVILKNDFLELVKKSPETKNRLEAIATARKIENTNVGLQEEGGALLDFMMTQGVTDADNILVIDSNLCIGCDNCEKACAATHGGNSRLDRTGGKSFAKIQIPISCRHCENPLCMTDCPPDALTRMSDGEVIIRDSCIGCGNCERNCPYGVIQMVYDKEDAQSFSIWNLLGFGTSEHNEDQKHKGPAKAAKCDLCRDLAGGPACVRSCPTGSAIRVNPRKLLEMAGQETN